MKTIVAFKTDKASFVTGLKWVSLSEPARRGRITKEMRSKIELQEATKIVVHSANMGDRIHSALGMYAPNPLELGQGGSGPMYSLAVAFVHAHPEHANSILAWRLPDNRAAVIIIQGGIPIADEVQNETGAISLMKKALSGKLDKEAGSGGAADSKYVIFTNDPVAFLNGEKISEQDFTNLANRASKLAGVPIRPTVVVGTAVVVAMLVGGGLFAHKARQAEKRAQLAAKVAAEDPLPPYQAALAANIGRLGLDRKALQRLLADANGLEVWVKGWKLTQTECAVAQCMSTWERDGGVTAELLATFPTAQLAEGSTSEKAILRQSMDLPMAGLPSLQHAVPMNVAATYVNVYQIWRNAKVTVTETENHAEFKPWPTPVQGQVSALPSNQTLKARKITVDVPLPLAQELLLNTPEAVWWSAMKIVVTPGDAQKMLTVTFTGNTYVR